MASPSLGGVIEPGGPPAPRSEKPPRYCPACGQDLSEYPYYERIAGPAAQRLQLMAKVSIPLMAILFVAAWASGYIPGFSSSASGYFIIAVVCSPAALLYAASQAFPRMFRVICLHCSWFRDYRFRLGVFAAEEKRQDIKQPPRATEDPGHAPP